MPFAFSLNPLFPPASGPDKPTSVSGISAMDADRDSHALTSTPFTSFPFSFDPLRPGVSRGRLSPSGTYRGGRHAPLLLDLPIPPFSLPLPRVSVMAACLRVASPATSAATSDAKPTAVPAFAGGSPALASGLGTCAPPWKLTHSASLGCLTSDMNSSLAAASDSGFSPSFLAPCPSTLSLPLSPIFSLSPTVPSESAPGRGGMPLE